MTSRGASFYINLILLNAPFRSVVTDVKWEWLYSTLTDGEYMLTKTVLDPKEDGTYDQATMYVTFVFGTP